MTNSVAPAWRGFLLGLLAFAFYSTGDVTVKKVTASYDAVQVFCLMQVVALPFMMAYVVWRGRGLAALQSSAPLHQVGRGLLFALQGLSAYYGFQNLPLAETYTFIFVMPIFTLIFAVMFLRERVSRLQVILMLISFAGVLVVFRPAPGSLNMVALVVLAGSAIGGLQQVMMRYLAGRDGFGGSLIYPVLTGAVVTGILALPNWQPMTAEALPFFIAGGLLVVAAHALMVQAYYDAPASQIAPTQYSQILWGVGYGYLVFGDVPDVYVLVGAALIVGAGVWLAKLEYQQTHG